MSNQKQHKQTTACCRQQQHHLLQQSNQETQNITQDKRQMLPTVLKSLYQMSDARSMIIIIINYKQQTCIRVVSYKKK